MFIKYIVVFRKDVRLPVHLQRAMAAEAEAAREARAKVYLRHYIKSHFFFVKYFTNDTSSKSKKTLSFKSKLVLVCRLKDICH